MSFLLDTNICSAHLRRPSGLTHRFIQHSGRLAISTVVLGELLAWAYRRPNPSSLLQLIGELRADIEVLLYDEVCAEEFGKVRGGLLTRGIDVSGPDMMIAATALAHNLTLVTNNTVDFQRIPDLQLVDWLTP